MYTCKPFLRYSVYAALSAVLLISLLLPGCDEFDNPNDPGGCKKYSTLIYPANDTTITNTSVDFRWLEPSCGADSYKLIIWQDLLTNPYDTILLVSNTTNLSLQANRRYYWIVHAYYGSPPNDSAASSLYNFLLQ